MDAKVNSYSLDPAEPSGREDWWDVAHGHTFWKNSYHLVDVSLDDYIVARAERGCPDCMSAILECPHDDELNIALGKAKHG